MSTEAARRVLADAVAERVFPAAVAEVGATGGVLWRDALGTLTFDASTRAEFQTPFDLASLTKVIATTSLVMKLADENKLAVDGLIASHFSEWRGTDRDTVAIRDLLEHASGLPARLVDAPPQGRREFEHDICALPLEYAPRTRSVYSDLGFILLGFLIEDCGGASLASQFAALGFDPTLTFELPQDVRRRAAPTLPEADDPRRGRALIGEVHDHYAAALGGVAGHTGLFGTASAVGGFARTFLRAARGDDAAPFAARSVAAFLMRSNVAGSSRALGWDTMLPTSSCGTRLSAAAFGHVGFTGTSLWIDPERDRYFVLLTNRANGGGTLDAMRTVRRAFHDALADL